MTSFSKWPPHNHIWFLGSALCMRQGFRNVSRVSIGIPVSNFMCMSIVAFECCLLMFSDVTLNLATWRPYYLFGFSGLLLYFGFGYQLLSIFSDATFKMAAWQPHWIFSFWIRRHGFGSVTPVCFGVSISNFTCMLFFVMATSLLIVSATTFKMTTGLPYWMFWLMDSILSSALKIKSKMQWHIT